MYVSSFTTLGTALSGVEAAEEELDTTGENISNADTPDYTDQTVDLVEAEPLTLASSADGGGLQLGTGVDVSGVASASDPYLDAAWRQQNANTNAASTSQTYTDQIQTAIDEPSSTGISSQLSRFWSDWNDLADNPTSTAAAQAVVDDGEQLTTSLNDLSAALSGSGSTSIISQAQAQYGNLMAGPTGAGATGGEVYNDAYDIASLNQAIVQAQAAGETPNNLIDQRNEAIDDLSSLGNVNVQDNTDGSVTVYFGGVTSTALVSDPVADTPGDPDPGNNFSTTWSTAWTKQFATANTAAQDAAEASGGVASAAALASSVGGTLGALIGLAGYSATGISSPSVPATAIGTIGQLSSDLDSVAASLVSEVNAPTVVDSNPPSTVALTTDFFVSTGTTASTIAVNPTLVANAADVQINTTGEPGDNDIALDEANNSGGAADTAYDAFVQQVGDTAQSAQDDETTQSALSTQITDQRQSVEGVDLSQEMSNLVLEQQAYEASAKVMDAFSTVMDALMDAVGAD